MSQPQQDEHHLEEEEEEEFVDTYKPGQKKSVAEYVNLDAEDESLRKWKEALGITSDVAGQSVGDPNDKRRVVIMENRIYLGDDEPIVKDLENPKTIEELKTGTIKIKEKIKYYSEIKFRVQHEIVTGLVYQQSISRMGVPIETRKQVMGSYPPNTAENPFYVKKFELQEAPSGFLVRGKYMGHSKYIDDDGVVHAEYPFNFEITKK
ncbi:Rho GDP-dissociation inhibitor [Yarrowia sp. C11]|nr:Rho GDP-dissociation inhibitor [Yarrowia sp. C11]